jgi:AcrR family transcriptional regulator
MGTSTPQRKYHHGDLRRALLDAAATQDPESISLRELATGLGVTPASVYRHFDSKQALLDELAVQGFSKLRAFFAECFDLDTEPVDSHDAVMRLVKLGTAYLKFADQDPATWRLMFGVHASAYRQRATADGLTSSYSYLPAALRGIHRRGLLPRVPKESDILFAWSAIHGLASLRQGGLPVARMPATTAASLVARRILTGLDASTLPQEWFSPAD